MELSEKENNVVVEKTTVIREKVERALAKIEKEHNIKFVNFQMIKEKDSWRLFTFSI